MINLRDDQIQTVNEVRDAMRDHQSVLLHAECGWGKTVASAFIAKSAEAKGKRITFVAHRRALLKQTAVTFRDFGISFGFIAAGMASNPFARVQIASADTIRNRPNLLKCDLLVPDEAHLFCRGKTRIEIIDTARQHGAHIMPLTATPADGTGNGLGNIADHIVHGPDAAWLIERGFLARYKAYAPFTPDLQGVRENAGEYATSALDERLDKPSIIGDRVSAYREYANGRRHIGYCYSRKNGHDTAAAFNDAGISARFVDGETPEHEMTAAINGFADRSIQVLLNCQLFREGFDLSAQVGRRVPIESVGLYAPCKSLPMAIQMMMRPMRPQENHAVLLDHAGIFAAHGLPDDEREWTLERRVGKQTGVSGISVSTCPSCFGAYRSALPSCPECGTGRPLKPRTVEEIAGELREVDRERKRVSGSQMRSARDLSSVVQLAVDRGYQPGWVAQRMRAIGQRPPSYSEIHHAMSEIRR